MDVLSCLFYANKCSVLCAMQHLACIIIYMQHSSLYTAEQIQPLQDLRDNLREQLACLRSEFNSWTQTASDLGASRQTIYNR